MRKNFNIPNLFSTHEIADLLGVDSTSVIGWCEKGKLLSHKTPGGHRRVGIQDLLNFLHEYKMPIPPALTGNAELTCLVVDDDPEIRGIVTRAIQGIDSKAKVEEAQDGFSAGQVVSEVLPRLVVLDINLPGMNGYKVCEKIRENPRLKQTKILAITGQDTPEAKKKILLAGADDFLAKPFETKVFKEVIQKLLK